MKKTFLYLLIAMAFYGCKDGNLLFIEANEQKGHHYPYFLFIPDGLDPEKESYVIVEPNNSGFVDDDLEKHIEKAERTASIDYYTGNYLARKLKYPLLVPVFPRSKSQWKVYTHALDRDAMHQKGNSLQRIDQQLVEMFNDARQRLKERNINTKNQFLLTGFSASGTFANRFAALHPGKVAAVAAGGLNGLLILPADSIDGKTLNYPLGTNNFEELTGKDFRMDLFSNTPQFYFMGELDENDAIPYDDAFDDDERELIYEIMGREMQPARWNYCKKIYQGKGIHATIKTYPEVGHEHPEEIKDEITAFFRKAINERKEEVVGFE
jgi:pimeloyl-ACP methyl ester carboxylesterase